MPDVYKRQVSSQVIEDLNYTEEDLIQLDDYPSIGSGNLEKAVITQNKILLYMTVQTRRRRNK